MDRPYTALPGYLQVIDGALKQFTHDAQVALLDLLHLFQQLGGLSLVDIHLQTQPHNAWVCCLSILHRLIDVNYTNTHEHIVVTHK